jgi:3-methylcrotonyl-CoA carboxylase alpha subunit
VEVRIYAENPRKRFLPSSGTLAHLEFPDNVRVDSGVAAGDLVSVYYDPMLAKMIAHGPNREAAIARLDAALQQTEIAGVEHNVAYLRHVIAHPKFLDGSYTTDLGEQLAENLVTESDSALAICAVIALQRMGVAAGPWGRGDGFRVNEPPRYLRRVRQGKQTLDVCVSVDSALVDGVAYGVTEIVCRDAAPGQQIRCVIDGQRIVARVVRRDTDVFVMHGGDTRKFTLDIDDLASYSSQAGSSGRITSPMPGQVISLSVAKGDRVTAGDVLLVVEAMKMEHAISSPRAGVVSEINCAVGERIDDDMDLIVLEP